MSSLENRALAQVARADITVVDDTQPIQTLQVQTGAYDQAGNPSVVDGVPMLMPYGVASNPPVASQTLVARLAGNPSLGVALGAHDMASRPKGLKPGDSQLYDVRGQSVALTTQGIAVTGKGGTFGVAGVSAVSLGASTSVQGGVTATGPVASGSNVTAAGDVTAGGGVASLLAAIGLIAGLLTASAAQAGEITALQSQAAAAAQTATGLTATQTQVAQNTSAIAQAQDSFDQTEQQVSAVLAQITAINTQIADLSSVAFDPAAQAASLLAAQTAQAAAEAARDSASVDAQGASVSAIGAGQSQTAAAASATAANASFLQAQEQVGLATNQAGIASSAAASATAQAAAAQQSASLAVSAGSDALNANATFASYAGTGTLPAGYQDDGGGVASSTMVAGFDSPNAIRFDCTTTFVDTSVQISQLPTTSGANLGLSFAGPGWYVLELDVFVHTQADARSAAAYLEVFPQATGAGTPVQQLLVSLGQAADIAGQTGIVTGRRQYAVLGQITSAASLGVAIQSNGAQGVLAGSDIEWHKVAVRVASSAEIASGQALTTANANTANLASFQSAQTSQNTSFATSLSDLNAAVFNATGGSLQSQIDSVSQAQATQQSAFASQISSVQAQLVTAPNLLSNGDFSNGLVGWAGDGSPFTAFSDPQIGTYAAVGGGTTQQFFTSIPYPIPDTAKLSISFSSSPSVAADLADPGYAYIQWLPSFTQGPLATSTNNWLERSESPVGSPPAGTTSWRVVVVKPVTTVATLFGISRIKVNTGPPTDWSDEATVGAMSTAIATLGGQLYSTYTLTATAGSVVTGMQLLSASGPQTISAVIFQAENFIIKSVSASAGVAPFAFNSTTGTLSLQNVVASSLSAISANLGSITAGQIVFDNGSTMLAIADPTFGTSSQFVMWFGTPMALNTCSESNAIFYLRVDGQAFFRGAIHAGTLSNSVTGTDTSATASTTLGPFGTQGGVITVAYSYSYSHGATRVARTATVSGAQNAVISLYRTITGQAEQLVAQQSVNGSSSVSQGVAADNSPDVVQTGMGGAWTFSDDSGGAANKTFRIAVSSRNDFAIGGTVFENQADTVAQSLSIVTSEG